MAPEAAAEEAVALLEGGFRAVKLRLGYPMLWPTISRGFAPSESACRATLR